MSRTLVRENDDDLRSEHTGVFVALDHWAAQLRTFDEEVQQLTNLATTFDISIPEYKT